MNKRTGDRENRNQTAGGYHRAERMKDERY